MMTKIAADHPIFQSETYLKDRTAFYYMVFNRTLPSTQHASDGKHYVISKPEGHYPTWIWDDDDLDQKAIHDLVGDLKAMQVQKLTCKQALYDKLRPYFECSGLFKMGAYYLSEVNDFCRAPGEMIVATPIYLNLVAQWWYEARIVMANVQEVSKTAARQEAKDLIASGNLYLWLDQDQCPCCMAHIQKCGDLVKFGHVFTAKEKRQKGYAKALIASLSEDCIAKAYCPVLYTDLAYPASNKAYEKVGFQLSHILNHVSIREETV